MVNTIHRSVVEKLQVEVPDTLGSDEIFGITSKLVETNEEHFKESLKNNTPCYVHRETFVVEHDTEKNKIIFRPCRSSLKPSSPRLSAKPLRA